MNCIRLLAAAGMLSLALIAPAQQNGKDGSAGVPRVEQQLKILTEKLALSGDQQLKIKPILQNLHEATRKAMLDKNLSREEGLNKIRPEYEKADQRMRAFLNDEQKKKLDQFEQEPHPEMHPAMD